MSLTSYRAAPPRDELVVFGNAPLSERLNRVRLSIVSGLMEAFF